MTVEKNLENNSGNVRRKIFYLTGSVIALVLIVIGVVYGTQHVRQARSISDWLEKEKDPEVKKAVEHMKNADLRYPTIKDAVIAARCADVKALSIMKKNGFTKWDDPEIMLAACKTPFLENVQMVHKFGGDVNAKSSGLFGGTTALMFAARDGSIETVNYLVSQGADVNAEKNSDEKVLDLAKEEYEDYLRSVGARKGNRKRYRREINIDDFD